MVEHSEYKNAPVRVSAAEYSIELPPLVPSSITGKICIGKKKMLKKYRVFTMDYMERKIKTMLYMAQ